MQRRSAFRPGASPLDEQRADVARINAHANIERQLRLAEAARTNLAQQLSARIGLSPRENKRRLSSGADILIARFEAARRIKRFHRWTHVFR